MTIEWMRDLIICICGSVGIITLIIITILSLLVYRKINVVLNYIHATTNDVSDVIETIREEFLNPITQTMTIIHGVKEGINMISRFFGRNKGIKE